MPNRHVRLDEPTALELKLATAVADERRRAARDIQAGVMQRLAAMRVLLTTTIEDGPEQSGHALQSIASALDTAMIELRETVSSAEPAIVAGSGIGRALAACSGDGSPFVAVEDRLRRRHPARTELAVFYACREATQNVLKHAGDGARVTVRLTEWRNGVRFRVVDDGAGFDADAPARGVGLLNIRERVESAGGRVAISSSLNGGTVVAGFVPDKLLHSGHGHLVSSTELNGNAAPSETELRRQIVLESDAERHRIMRDLHDGAQQRLVALRVRISLTDDALGPASNLSVVLTRLGEALDLAIAELSDLCRGLLVTTGRQAVAPALRTVTRHWTMPVRVRERNVRRHARQVEAAVYGCILEALQDARDAGEAGNRVGTHPPAAGMNQQEGPRAVVSLFEAPGAIHFVVRGRGIVPQRLDGEPRSDHVIDRAAVAGGSMSLHETPNEIVVRGSIPISGAA